MSSYWRNAGLTYIKYSSIVSRVIRDSLKADLKPDVFKRSEDTIIKATRYEGGKPVADVKAAS